MKKIIFTLICIFFLTGCTNTISYDFKKNSVESTIKSEFTDAQYVTYNNKNAAHDFKIQLKDADSKIKNEYEQSSPGAYLKDGKASFYEPVTLEYENNDNVAEYKYSFDYDNFKYNYFFKKCFDTFVTYENDDFRYYQVEGKFKCDNPETIKIKVSSDYKIVESNPDDMEGKVQIWNVKLNQNNIKFAISKKEKNGFSFSLWNIIPLVIIIGITLISAIIVKKANKNN